jgi:DNA-sulfur modification-associated
MVGKSTQDWEVKTQGTYGEFHTLAGKVSYLMTKAKLKADTTPEGILTKHLAPVREVLEIKDLDFNQLLQRDLDDYRVATDLVDYLLKPNFVGPAFYTPILAAVLPFDGPNPVDRYPENGDNSITKIDDIDWQQTQYGDAFRVLKLWDSDIQRPHKITLGRLDFNSSRVKLVVIDGQHRAMALLAIRRTIDHNWKEGGSAYRYFYEQRINDLLKDRPKDFLENIEFPVCICWFPQPTSDNSSWPNPHKAARKLFVDVNKNARSPSKSRLILLSDSELTSIFVREFLNHLRTKDARFPLHAIEYDYPHEQGEGVPIRKTALASILMLNGAIEWALQGQDKYITDVNKTIQQGRVNEKDKKQRLHRELELEQCLAPDINDQGINGPIKFARKDLTNEHFPKTEIQTLIQQFWQGWGTVILHIFSEFFPFKCHIEALKELELSWNATEDHGTLARKAMFEGLGIYWTLQEDYRQWSENNQNAELQGIPKQEKNETVKAWEAIQIKEQDFQQKRTQKLFYRQRNIEEKVKEKAATNIYKRLFTQAFLSGAVLTLASLKYQLKYDSQTFKERAIVWIESWNLALKASPNRIHIFDASQTWAHAENKQICPFLDFIKLNPAAAVYFRYLLLEFMQVSGSDELTPEEKEAIARLLTQARKLYFEALVKDEEKTLKKKTNKPKEADKNQVKEDAKNKLKIFCQEWFKMTQYEFERWYEDANSIIQNDSQNLHEDTDFDDDN